MHLFRKKYLAPKYAFVVGVFVVIVGSLIWSAQEVQTIEQKPVSKEVTYDLHEATSLPFVVSGVVTATDEVTVRAQTAGIIDSVLVTEGTSVTPHQLLVSQDTPVLNSSIALQEARGQLDSLQQTAASAAKIDALTRSKIIYADALAQEVLKNSDAAGRVLDAAAQLLTGVESSVLNIVTILDFADGNRAFLATGSGSLYLDIVSTLYDRQPGYLSAGITYRVSSTDDILDQIEKLKKQEVIDVDQLLALSVVIDRQLTQLQTLLADAEKYFFDESQIDESSPLYEAYLTHRADAVQAQSDLRALYGSLRTLLDGTLQKELALGTQVQLSAVDQSAAQAQKGYSQQIVGQTAQVDAAQLGVLYAQYALTQSTAPFAGNVSKVFVEKGDYVQLGAPLMQLVGVSGYELSVQVPLSVLPLLQVGQTFTVEGEVVGMVSHFSPTAARGNIEVFIDLLSDDIVVGQVLLGKIALETTGTDIALVPREYIHFTTQGIFLKTHSGLLYPARILFDGSDVLYVQLDDKMKVVEPLVPALGITL